MEKMYVKILFFFAIFLVVGWASTTPFEFDDSVDHHCGTSIRPGQQEATETKLNDFRAWCESDEGKESESGRIGCRNGKSKKSTVVIPLTFYNLHDGENGYLDDEILVAQLDVINANYASTNFQFELVDSIRIDNSYWFSQDMTLKHDIFTRWINHNPLVSYPIYFIDTYLLGYCNFPDTFEEYDSRHGCMVNYNSLPDEENALSFPYAEGKTLTHELGHGLGLYHTFQGGCGDLDFVDDTFPQEAPTSGCPDEVPVSCETPDNIYNFMDYSYDVCMVEFTPDQSNRMDEIMAIFKPVTMGITPPYERPNNHEIYENACGMDFYDSGGIDGDYQEKENMLYTFCSGDDGAEHVVITFDSFEVDPFCYYSFMWVFDGSDVSAPLIANDFANEVNEGYCGAYNPRVVYSTNENKCISVLFTSTSFTEAGWSAKITCEAEEPYVPTPAPIFQHYCEIEGGILSQDGLCYVDGEVTGSVCGTKFYDNGGQTFPYSDYSDETFTFCNPDGPLEIIFESFGIEEAYQCIYDYMVIFDGPNTESPTFSSSQGDLFCGYDLPQDIVSTNEENCLTFHFYSDYSVTDVGWSGTFNCLNDETFEAYVFVLYRDVFSQLRNLEGFLAMNDEFKESRVFTVTVMKDNEDFAIIRYGDQYLHCSPSECSFQSDPSEPFGIEMIKDVETGTYFYLYQNNSAGRKRFLSFDDKFFMTQRPKHALIVKAVTIE